MLEAITVTNHPDSGIEPDSGSKEPIGTVLAMVAAMVAAAGPGLGKFVELIR
ncbi:hypothetical protein VPK24_15810 [Limnothrix redekei LRLZ20PSL1]|uniref:Uncharacterized protein n=1 Tax=Limnothrix redekei LRLZ20PSL1 TaxID=3112953 RepID=A0ABW7CDA0_9CYAN